MGRKNTTEGLYLRKDSKFFWMSFTANGRSFNKSTGTADKGLAKKILAKTLTLIAEGKWFDIDQAAKHSYDELMDKFISEHAPSVSPNTQASYGYSRKHLDEYFSGMTLSQIDSEKVSEYRIWRRGQGCKPATRNREVAMLGKAFSLAVHPWKWMKNNPCYKLPMEPENNDKTGQALPENIEEEVLMQCRKHLFGQLEDMAIIAIHTGCRRREVVMLRDENINLDLRQLSVIQKGDTLKVCAMTNTVHAILSKRRKVKNLSGYIFVNPETGKPWHLRTVSRELKVACSDAGLSTFRFHDLRHTTGTRLGQAGKDIRTIAGILGHSKLETSRRYIKHSTEGMRQVVNDVFEPKKKEVVNE
jgi:site-specific recombinase XerD